MVDLGLIKTRFERDKLILGTYQFLSLKKVDF